MRRITASIGIAALQEGFDGKSATASHGQPWIYDTHAPVIWVGPGIEPGRIGRRVETVNVAPTISAYLSVKYPSDSRGKPLVEVEGSDQ